MENAEEIFHFLEEFSKRKTKTIPQELNDYLAYIARTGDPVYQWSLVKALFKEKLLNVITDFYETSPGIDIPPYPNVDPFNYDIMKNSLIERLESFTSAPFTIQRICELLTYPRKQYNRIDKFMRAIEKNILVVSTREPGAQRHVEPENAEHIEPIVNGTDNNSEYNVDVEMEDMSWKENSEQQPCPEPQASSSDANISVNDIEVTFQNKQNSSSSNEKITQFESITPSELNTTSTDLPENSKQESILESTVSAAAEVSDLEPANISISQPEIKIDKESNSATQCNLIIPEIKIDDVEMTEQKICEEKLHTDEKSSEDSSTLKEETGKQEEDISKQEEDITVIQQTSVDENSSDSNSKDETDLKNIPEILTTSEESSSSSDNIDGNSNSPNTNTPEPREESNQSDDNCNEAATTQPELQKENTTGDIHDNEKDSPSVPIQSDNYSIMDVNSVLSQLPIETSVNISESETKSTIENTPKESENNEEEQKTESPVTPVTDDSLEP